MTPYGQVLRVAVLFGDIDLALWLLLAAPLIVRKLIGDPEQHRVTRIYDRRKH